MDPNGWLLDDCAYFFMAGWFHQKPVIKSIGFTSLLTIGYSEFVLIGDLIPTEIVLSGGVFGSTALSLGVVGSQAFRLQWDDLPIR